MWYRVNHAIFHRFETSMFFVSVDSWIAGLRQNLGWHPSVSSSGSTRSATCPSRSRIDTFDFQLSMLSLNWEKRRVEIRNDKIFLSLDVVLSLNDSVNFSFETMWSAWVWLRVESVFLLGMYFHNLLCFRPSSLPRLHGGWAIPCFACHWGFGCHAAESFRDLESEGATDWYQRKGRNAR